MTTPADRAGASYRELPVLVTGGLGFIGSNLVRRLHALGARVTVLDSLSPGQGGNPANLAGLAGAITIVQGDQADAALTGRVVAGQAVIFNLCGRGAHADSMREPLADMHANITAQIVLLEAVRTIAPDARVIYGGTRSQYGRAEHLPVREDAPLQPTDVNGAHKMAGERLHLVYHTCYGLHAGSLRLTNIYGPRQLMAHGRQGFLNWFMRLALDGEQIQVFGDGEQLRDVLYVDDAIDAFLLAGMTPAIDGQALNIASGEGASVRALAEATIAAAGSGSLRLIPYPPEHRAVEVGDFVADITAARDTLGWQPRTSLMDGLTQTAAFFRTRRADYWNATA